MVKTVEVWITSPTPSTSASSRPDALQLPTTFAPRMRAICTAERPTPPKRPVIKTDWPALSLAYATSAFHAVTPTKVKAAACSNEMDGGLSPTFSSSATTYSANAPA
jgi:hypothetical protein